ncbi:aminodeoxychorismate synthase component I [Hyphomicrobium sp. NDB2Meth4]|uniref:aminodeoxychorismate synthase component I n=1 Tax=Hyphomicrobium sp. NDB2Meth4 TaxID=1892846 RepID=UPI000930B6DB|nr:aminodeoxychorismate synthase component I [Hyphomicrobium sp. NDB2Meth4]
MTSPKPPPPGRAHPAEDAAALSQTFVLLDNNSGSGPPSLLFSDPVEIVSAWNPEDVPQAMKRIEDGVASGLYAAGFFAFELGYVMEPKLAPLMPEKRNVPLLWIGLYKAPIEMTSSEVEHWLATHTRSGSFRFTDVSLSWSEAEYVERFNEVIDKIRAGDIYQLNLTFKSRFKLAGSPLTFFLDLRQKQRVAYGGIVDTGEMTVLSASPELFIEQNGRTIFTRPMKGTAPRAGTEEADAEARRELAADVKQRAENLMIVDLMRNDIGRISDIGSVEVTDLFTVETYKTLHQLTSGVRARLHEGVGIGELMRAIFPPGSVIGAPKIRAQELIRQLETEARGVYCGSIGYISPKGQSLFNVAIRTAVVFRNGDGEMGIGSGVVFDSQGTKEYEECLLKMKFLTDPVKRFDLIETLLYDAQEGGFALLERHIERLATSARYFAFVYDDGLVRDALAQAVEGKSGRQRVRLLLAEDGKVTVTATQLPPADASAVMRFALSSSQVDSADLFLFHKTTRRELYDRERQEYAERLGTDEVIYTNERGELTEGSFTTLFIERNGVLLTPQLEAGLLPGTLRAELLAEGRAREAVLTPADLDNADAIYLGNSVRGLLRAVRVEAS